MPPKVKRRPPQQHKLEKLVFLIVKHKHALADALSADDMEIVLQLLIHTWSYNIDYDFTLMKKLAKVTGKTQEQIRQAFTFLEIADYLHITTVDFTYGDRKPIKAYDLSPIITMFQLLDEAQQGGSRHGE